MVRDAMVAKELAALGETVVREAFKNQFRTVSRVMPSIWPMVL